ncbi:MAG TPA: cyclic nucleotide-binding domain-containing protein [bacterium]|nr:cyclic nucleotide-binding domain-containing protein [bacterium]
MTLKFQANITDISDFSQIFHNLSGFEMEIVKEYLEQQKYPGHIPICAEGKRGEGIFLINSGEVKVIKKTPEGAKPLGKLGKGDVFGEISMLANIPYTASVYTATECELTFLSRKNFEVIKEKHTDIAFKIITTLAEILAKRLIELNTLLL